MPVKIDDYSYHLPEEKIALYPLDPRHTSKLLVYENGKVSQDQFFNLDNHLNNSNYIVFNNTKVIPARLFFKKQTGASIEIFLLDPLAPTTEVVRAMESPSGVTWKCMIGNLKKWKNNEVLHLTTEGYNITADLIDKEQKLVTLSWDNAEKKMIDVIQDIGKLPIPPYLNRAAEEKDNETYQTVYANNHGAVAAPTAGLHFTEEVFKKLAAKNIKYDFVTLHVGAGTFQPVKEKHDVTKHEMHAEQFVVKLSVLENLLDNIGNTTVVGTTSMRTLESLFWLGNQLMNNKTYSGFVSQNEPYVTAKVNNPRDAINALVDYLEKNGNTEIHAATAIMIYPGYEFKICNNLITNFHQPGSTLMLLVAAFIGDNWRTVYNYALENEFRFLSYGDSSLLKR